MTAPARPAAGRVRRVRRAVGAGAAATLLAAWGLVAGIGERGGTSSAAASPAVAPAPAATADNQADGTPAAGPESSQDLPAVTTRQS